MKKQLSTFVLLLLCNLTLAQTSHTERLSSVAIWMANYKTLVLSEYDSVQYSYPNAFQVGGTEQSYEVANLSSSFFSKQQWYHYQNSVGIITTQSFSIQRLPDENKIIMSTIDDDQTGGNVFYHTADSVVEYDKRSNMIMFRKHYYFGAMVAITEENHSYNYNGNDQLIADTIYKRVKVGAQPQILKYFSYLYDVKGNRSVKAEYQSTGDTLRYIEYSYDDESRTTRELEFSNQGELSSGIYYLYDDLNNVQSRDYVQYHWNDTMFADRSIRIKFSDRIETRYYQYKNSDWFLNTVTTDKINASGLIVERSILEYSDTLMPNGTHWKNTMLFTYAYNHINQLVYSDIKFYHAILDSLIFIEKRRYHWEPFIISPMVEPFTIQCYPVPCQNEITVTYNAKDEGPCEISLLNTFGVKMSNQQVHAKVGVNQVVLDTKGLSVGNYIVFLQMGKQRNSVKILKN